MFNLKPLQKNKYKTITVNKIASQHKKGKMVYQLKINLIIIQVNCNFFIIFLKGSEENQW